VNEERDWSEFEGSREESSGRDFPRNSKSGSGFHSKTAEIALYWKQLYFRYFRNSLVVCFICDWM